MQQRYDASSVNLTLGGISRGCKKILDRVLGEPKSFVQERKLYEKRTVLSLVIILKSAE
jgi:hypothetical protein